MSFHLDSIKSFMSPKAKEETPTLEEGKEQRHLTLEEQKLMHRALRKSTELVQPVIHEDEITRAYIAMKQGKDGLLEEGKTIKEDDEPATITKMGAQIARQDKVKLGGKTPVNIHPNTAPMSVKDTNTIGMSKKGYKSVAKTTGEEITQKGERVDEIGKKTLNRYVQKATDSTVPIALTGNDKKFYNRLSGINKAKMRIKGVIPPNRNIGKVKVRKEEVDEGIAGALLKTGAKLVGATISKGLGITPGTLSYIRNQQNIASNIRSQANRSHARHLAKHVAQLNKQHAKHMAHLNKAQAAAAKPAAKATAKAAAPPTPPASTGNPPSHVSRQSFHAALKAAGGNLKHVNPAHLQAASPRPAPAANPVSPTRHQTIKSAPAAKPPQPQSALKPQTASKPVFHPVTMSAVHKANRARPIVRASMGTTNWKPTNVTMGKPRLRVKQQSFKSEYEHERNDLLQEVIGGWKGFNTNDEIGKMSHEDLLDNFLNHHNKAMKA